MKKILCLLIVVMMCVSLAAPVFAAEDDGFTDSVVNTEPTEPEETTAPTDGGGGDGDNDDDDEDKDPDVPNTGDANGPVVMMWVGVMVLSAGALVVLLTTRRKTAE